MCQDSGHSIPCLPDTCPSSSAMGHSGGPLPWGLDNAPIQRLVAHPQIWHLSHICQAHPVVPAEACSPQTATARLQRGTTVCMCATYACVHTLSHLHTDTRCPYATPTPTGQLCTGWTAAATPTAVLPSLPGAQERAKLPLSSPALQLLQAAPGAELGLGWETMEGLAHSVPDARKDGRVAKSKSKNKTQIRQWRRRRARGSGSQPERGPNEQQKGSSEQEVPTQEGGGMGHVKG